ncbi:hypothetical protein ACFCY8_10430 [Streptomyces noursei]|uniref:hypothetical protein n=1 Tax=Streptomyces noursei TaxID=1971 RepID=UPI0035D625BF
MPEGPPLEQQHRRRLETPKTTAPAGRPSDQDADRCTDAHPNRVAALTPASPTNSTRSERPWPALSRPLPARPDDATARALIRRILDRQRRSDHEITVDLNGFHQDRLALQRSTAWIEDELQRLADEQPDFLVTRPRSYGTGTEFTIMPFKADARRPASHSR